MPPDVSLREVQDADLPVFYAHQQDPEGVRMAAFTKKDPADRAAFAAHWARLRTDATIVVRTIVLDGGAVGHIAKWERDGVPEVTYWVGRKHWGRGVATAALAAFLREVTVRPIRAGAAADNAGSIRVLEKCGFVRCGEGRGFANARGAEIAEVLFELA